MRELEKEIGAAPAEIALAYLLQNKAVTSVLFGATKIEQVESNLRASGLTLPDEAMAKLNGVSALPPEFGRDTVAPARAARQALL
jgi:aryl-alcohol dehydrogenase-like predicted oxidoreductase